MEYSLEKFPEKVILEQGPGVREAVSHAHIGEEHPKQKECVQRPQGCTVCGLFKELWSFSSYVHLSHLFYMPY